MSSTTTTPAGTPTTVSDNGTCPLGRELGDDSGEARRLRQYRDKVLLSTDGGQMMAELYYDYAAEISRILRNSRPARRSFRKALSRIISAMKASGDSEKIILDKETTAALLEAGRLIRQEAGPELFEIIGDLREELRQDELGYLGVVAAD